MARITVEDCLTKENNRFSLVLLAAKRTKQLLSGSKVVLGADKGNNKPVVTALREIADGKVRFMTPEEAQAAREAAQQAEAEAAARAQAEAAQKPQGITLENVFAPRPQASPEPVIEGSDDSDDDDDDESDESAIEDKDIEDKDVEGKDSVEDDEVPEGEASDDSEPKPEG